MTEKAMETQSGYDLTATIGGQLKLSKITKKDGFEPSIDEEIKVRKIPNNLQEWIEAIREVEQDEIDSVLEEIPFNDKKKFLRWHETNRVVIEKNSHLTKQEAYDQAKMHQNRLETCSERSWHSYLKAEMCHITFI